MQGKGDAMRYLLCCLLMLTACHRSETPVTDKVIEFVNSEAEFLSGGDATKYRFYAAISAMNYVQNNLSSARAMAVNYQQISGTELCLIEKRGACGNQVEAFIDILKAMEIPARPIQVYYQKDGIRYSHIVAEVEWNNRWHMFDVTWGFVPHNGDPLSSLSYSEARERGTTQGLHNYAIALRVQMEQTHPIFQYLFSGEVVTDGRGTVHIPLENKRFNFDQLPNYVGRAQTQSGNIGTLNLTIDASGILVISPSSIACKSGKITTGIDSAKITESPMTIRVSGQTKLGVISNEKICYVVINRMTVH
jgi:hypothetical protein